MNTLAAGKTVEKFQLHCDNWNAGPTKNKSLSLSISA